jgi:FAD/FMN-containing dehydrogenase
MNMAPAFVHMPHSRSYEEATRLWNGAVRVRPGMVVQPLSAGEVAEAVTYARANGLAVAVRGGGHDWAGRALVHNGVVIDLSRMAQVEVDPEAQVATIGGGATAADAVAATEVHGLAPATGVSGQVGLAGLTLGGGYGPLNGVAGMALDNLLGAEVVLPDGRIVNTDAEHEPELFWALRGGGGNFGVVTAMRVRLHRVAAVHGGFILFPWDQAGRVFAGYDALVPAMPDELTVQIGSVSGPDGQPVVFLSPVWSSAAEPSDWLARLAGLGTPVVQQVEKMSYSTLLRLFDPYIEWGRHYAMRTRTLRSLQRGAIDAVVRAGDTRSSAHSGIVFHHCHGAATRVALGDTAFGIREPHFVAEILPAWDPADDPKPHLDWADRLFVDLQPHAVEGGYVNLIGPENAAQARKAYGPNATRLVAAKRHYDPENVFNATILPVQ